MTYKMRCTFEVIGKVKGPQMFYMSSGLANKAPIMAEFIKKRATSVLGFS